MPKKCKEIYRIYSVHPGQLPLRRREGCGTIRPHVALLRAQTDVENVDHHTHPAPARREVPFTKLRSRFRSAALVA
jgi:hypothetical protein